MKVSDVKCNGIGPFNHNHPSRQQIQTAISLLRMRISKEEIFEKFPKGHDYYAGSRFNSDNDVAIRIMSAITDNVFVTHINKRSFDITDDDNLLVIKIIESFVNSLKGSEMDELIIDGMRDCAGADHWYTFEKEWE